MVKKKKRGIVSLRSSSIASPSRKSGGVDDDDELQQLPGDAKSHHRHHRRPREAGGPASAAAHLLHLGGNRNSKKATATRKKRNNRNSSSNSSVITAGSSSSSKNKNHSTSGSCAGGGGIMSSPLRLRLPALVTPTERSVDEDPTSSSSSSQSNTNNGDCNTSAESGGGGGGGGAGNAGSTKRFFRRVKTPNRRGAGSTGNSGSNNTNNNKKYGVDTSFDSAVLGIRAPPSLGATSASSGVPDLYGSTSPSYDNDDDDDDDDEDYEDYPSDDDNTNIKPFSFNKEASSTSSIHSSDSSSCRGDDMVMTIQTGGSNTSGSGALESRISSTATDASVNKAYSPRLGISRPSYATTEEDLEDDEIVFEEVQEGDDDGVEGRNIFEQSWMSDEAVDNNRVGGKEEEEEKKQDDDTNCCQNMISCSPNAIEMTYQEPDTATTTTTLAEAEASSSVHVIPPTSPTSTVNSSPEKIIHCPTAQGQYLDEKFVPSLAPNTYDRGIRYSLENGKATTANGTPISKKKIGSRSAALNTTPAKKKQLQQPCSQTIKIFVLLLLPDSKIFELIQLVYPTASTSLGDILDMIPKNATEPALAKQTYVAVTRPKKKSPDYSDRTLLASKSSLHKKSSSKNRKSNNIGLVQGEIILAIPSAFSHLEIVRLGKKILANPRIQKLLEKSNPLAPSKKTKSCKIRSSSNKASNSVHSLEKVVEEDEEDSLLGASPMKKTSYWLSKPGSLDAFLESTAFGSRSSNGDRRDDHDSANEGRVRRRSNRSADILSPGSHTSSQHLLDAYLSDSSKRRRSIKAQKQREQQQRKLDACLASPMSSVRSSIYNRGAESTPTRSDLGDNNRRLAAAAKNSSALGSRHHHRGGGDSSSVVTDASHSTWSNNSATTSQQHRRIHRYGSTSSFASLGRSTRSRPSAVNDNVNSANASLFLIDRRNKHLRMKKRWVSVAKLVAALLLTMAVRFYLDPNGYSALMEARRNEDDDEASRFHNQPLGILGALQLLLFFNLLVKLQRALEEGTSG